MVTISNEYQVVAHHINGVQTSSFKANDKKRLNSWISHLIKYGIDFEVKFCTYIDGRDVNHKGE